MTTLWSVIVALSVTSIRGYTAAHYVAVTTDVTNSSAVNATRHDESTGDTTAHYVAVTTDVTKSRAVNATPNDASAALSLRESCLMQGRFYCQIQGSCIPFFWHCDGAKDCLYNEDELGCPTRTSTFPPTTPSLRESCLSERKFYCQSQGLCIPFFRHCDGVDDCLYNEDELGCPTRTSRTTPSLRESCLSERKFYCQSQRLCIPFFWHCDGAKDCLYNEDELDCPTRTSTLPPTRNTTANYDAVTTDTLNSIALNATPNDASIGDTTENYRVVPLQSDNSSAGSSTSTPSLRNYTASATELLLDSCLRQGNFYCEYSRKCIVIGRHCDGHVDCPRAEDESGCAATATTSRPEYIHAAASKLRRGYLMVVIGYVTVTIFGFLSFWRY